VLGESELAERALLSLEGAKLAAEKLGKRSAAAAAVARKAAERRAAATGTRRAPGAAGDVEMVEESGSVGSGSGSGSGAAGDASMGVEEGGAAGGAAGAGAAAASGGGAAIGDLAELLGGGWVSPGQYVALHIERVPVSVLREWASAGGAGGGALPLVAWGL
jgi:hypothetical protein